MQKFKLMKLSGETLFVALLLVLCVVYFIDSLSLRKIAAQAPQVVIVPLFILLVFQLIALLKRELNKISNEPAEEQSEQASGLSDLQNKASNVRVFQLFLWILAYVISVHFVGQLITLVLFLLFFLRYMSKSSWKFSFLFTLLMFTMIFVLFSLILEKDFYPGNWFLY